ncbi:glucose-1-phosphate adenylyltransferase [Desulforamulus reducens MI-1]|uniref:Glucose-1-phosphate adenylyltransferase n=1 Tax=Desulforamulus reducens (strain ATCC BAA-1160 / DSM 100696 / MI-1) TaxID=349161 RepID=GLGC_DESRM|nr:glucose-1-phosphate adenylyltransferase [Desulforamulus reducens]A4J4I2.1 RecName: Full=Glucose-1-phosphate adenylyltransferase; AltName: Full=ADP-glucose pyrophosphorylase; Short=ADPGlc PPase; AltName: Full=ADP-glucose synthase [Desulforamulus reducens MI-1]ABO49985.1 glucose-1-phosphate adenylyltransferase [Desulforamulus reducens MI-1]
MQRKECVAMLLAGGQGSRLGVLTKKLAKPAVPFGGRYRIIDFTLSNCNNSGFDTVGVLTQYQPLALNTYIGIGSHWDLDRKNGGVTVLPPFVKEMGGEWYKGTANAIYQNIEFVDQYKPKYILILSGDHIYKMDYSLMLDFHKEKQADATIAVIEVPWQEASGFGIMNTAKDARIVEFEEKPKVPRSNLASMGVYIFNWELLKAYLEEDERNPRSSNDFGKNIIPLMLEAGQRMFAYPFKGYWRDVGTIESLWQANMDLLLENPKLDLNDQKWRIYSVTPHQPPQYVAPSARVNCSLINEGCMVFGNVYHSILFPGVDIGKGSTIRESVILSNVKIGKNVIVERAIVGVETIIEDNCHIGCKENSCPEDCSRITVVEGNIIVPTGSFIKKDCQLVGKAG